MAYRLPVGRVSSRHILITCQLGLTERLGRDGKYLSCQETMVAATLESVVESIVRSYDCVLVDLVANVGSQAHGGQLLVTVGALQPGQSVTADRCAEISRAIGEELESRSLDSGWGERYTLEVGTPGLTRKLRSERELAYGVGRPVRAVLRPTADNKGGEVVLGVLARVESQQFEIDTGSGVRTIARDSVKTIQLDLLAAPSRARR